MTFKTNSSIDTDLISFTLDEANSYSDIQYADIKWVQRQSRDILVKNDILENVSHNINGGIGIKLMVNGAYGFASTNVISKSVLKSLVKRAYRIATASAKTMKKPLTLSSEPVYEDKVSTSIKTDPSEISLDDTISYLIDSTKHADISDPRVKVRIGTYSTWKDHMILWTSEGSKIDQEVIVCGGGINVLAVDSGETQTRGFPGGYRGDLATAGYEYFKEQKIIDHAEETANEAIKLVTAPKCPARNNATVIILPGQLMLQLHENGHGFEMDRAYDYEAAFAGTSFLKPHLLNNLNFGNELITIHADATYPNGLGTFNYDHEGVKAQKTLLVDKGKFVGYLSSRETAGLQDWKRSSGSARSSAFDRMPLIRMTNINLEPGDWDYYELIEDTKDGFIMETNVSWSIDDLRLSFQFGTEIGWKVENGEITGLIRNPNYTGITPQFWNSANAVCKEKYFKMFGTPNCGKGEPIQTMYTGHGSSPVRFENVRIGVVQL